VRVFVGLGSNVGDRLANLRAAVDALRTDGEIRFIRGSSVYETDPVGPAQPDFLNAVLEIDTDLSALEILRRLKAIEERLGRLPRERWGPREIDLDLLVYGDRALDEEDVRVPHPEIANRAFVLVPLDEIAPDLEAPGLGAVRSLLARTGREGVRRTEHVLS
jgi:2-amino-4-hydroxy-6-hydroxymethyldihydropteridine diphosphokinase